MVAEFGKPMIVYASFEALDRLPEPYNYLATGAAIACIVGCIGPICYTIYTKKRIKKIS